MKIEHIKSQLRKTVREDIASLPGEYIAHSNEGILRRVLALDEYAKAKHIMLYHSIDREPDTIALARHALKSGKKVAFPFCYKGGIMQAHEVSSLSVMKPAMLGIPAPPENSPVISPELFDLIIVPALSYDKDGYRLGYGGGYYDRYLCNLSAYTVGITRQRLLRNDVPKEPHDVAVHCLVTEEEVFAQC